MDGALDRNRRVREGQASGTAAGLAEVKETEAMARIQTGSELGLAVCKVLGIDSSKVLEVSLSMKPSELATVTIVRSMDEVEGSELVTVLRRYVLCASGGTVADPAAKAMETVARNLTRLHGGGSGG